MSNFDEALVRGDVPAVASILDGLDEPARRALGEELVAHVRRRRDNWWARREATALAVAAVGTLSTPTKAAALLGRRSVSLRDADPEPVIAAARRRGVTWLAELAYKLADRLQRNRPWEDWLFVEALLRAERAAPPTTDEFVAGWAYAMWWRSDHRNLAPLADRLRVDPFLDVLLPRLFEVDGVGDDLTSPYDRQLVPSALAALAAEGRIDRSVLLDGVLGRLLRGDRPVALRPFLVLHDLLAPTPAEAAARAATYLRLLADAPGPVATLAQRTLRDLGDTVELESLLDAARTVLTRPEKALVRAQLSWLDRLARQRPDRAAEIGAVLAVAVEHPAAELRDRAVALAQRHGHRPERAIVVAVAEDELPPPVPPADAPPPIADVDELAEEVAALYGGGLSPMPLERVLDAVVRLSGQDEARLAAALRPVLDRHQLVERQEWSDSVWALLGDVLVAATCPSGAASRRAWWTRLLDASRRWGLAWALDPTTTPGTQRPAPARLLRSRLAEIGERLGRPGDQGLLASPSSVTGALDPAVLYDRVAALRDRPAGRWDLTQALLRLPATPDEALAARAAALGTPAGERLAERLRSGGLGQPRFRVVTVDRRARAQQYDWWYDNLPERRTLVETAPREGADDPLQLLTVPAWPVGTAEPKWSNLWSAALPGHRGVLAAHALPRIAATADQDLRDGRGILPALAECTGVPGPALHLALAYGLCARHEEDRVAAVDALLMLAAAGDLDAAEVGRHFGTLAADGRITLSRATGPLRDAVTAGARLSTWRLLATALPALLATPAPPRGTPDLLTLAAEAATATGVRLDVPGLADVVARGGGNRLVTEARRLTSALAA